MMDKRLTVIYADAAEKFVKNVVLYGFLSSDGGDDKLYYDAEHTQLVNGKDLINLCQKGLIVEVSYTIPSLDDYAAFEQEHVMYWSNDPRQDEEGKPIYGVSVSTWNNNYFNEFVEEEVEAEEEAE